jgi:hypothetical protein
MVMRVDGKSFIVFLALEDAPFQLSCEESLGGLAMLVSCAKRPRISCVELF